MDAMTQVQQGMHVVDAAGEDIGTVEDMKMGDPEAATAQGQGAGVDGGLVGDVAQAFGGGEPDVPQERAERMLRLGYIKIDTKGLFAGDLYAAADRVDRVERDTVHLTVNQDELTKS